MSTMEPSPEQFVAWYEAALAKYKEEWGDNPAFRVKGPKMGVVVREVARLAYQAGADAELEACCEWMTDHGRWPSQLCAARRPKPPSLKQQAKDSLDRLTADLAYHGEEHSFRSDIIRRALESLPDDTCAREEW